MEIQNLVPIEWANQRVLLTVQVAEFYDCPPSRIKDNFRKAKEQFQEGVHYFKVQGKELKQLKESILEAESFRPNSPVFNATYSLMLWTKQGVARHCKMLNTQKAWDVFNVLEQCYFNQELAPLELPAPEVVTLEQEVIRLRKQIANKSCGDLAVVYVLLMSNGTVKIGMTDNLTRRIKELKAETGLFVLNFDSTKFMPREEAAALEEALKEKYAADCLGGEFFDVRFLDVAAQL